jgi:murein DD-endopeptidase MepM/ murein hydrolase activator NlpD
MRRLLLPSLVGLSLALAATIAPAADAPGKVAVARSETLVVQVVVPGVTPETHGLLEARDGSATAGDDRLVVGAAVAAEATHRSVAAGTTPTTAHAKAAVTIGAIDLLGGLITVRSLRVEAVGSAAGGSASARATGTITGLVIDGTPRTATTNGVFDVRGAATVTTLETVEVVRGTTGRRAFITALHVRLRVARAGYRAGTEILVGYADAGAAAPRVAATTARATAPTAPTPTQGHDTSVTEDPPPGGFTTTPPIDPTVRAALLDATYAFPVVGGASFSNDFGGPRADTGFHQGIDLFAANGTPLVALHDGTLFNVGWNRLGGHRLWLDDGRGNLFYYAHLSGYAPIARDGAVVHAGDVIGFMGDSGDAAGTPFHLHLEIHPGGRWAVPPIGYVEAWQKRTPGASVGLAPPVPAAPASPTPATAEIESASDISSASGLDTTALLRAAGGGEVGAGSSPPSPILAVAGDAAPAFAGLR